MVSSFAFSYCEYAYTCTPTLDTIINQLNFPTSKFILDVFIDFNEIEYNTSLDIGDLYFITISLATKSPEIFYNTPHSKHQCHSCLMNPVTTYLSRCPSCRPAWATAAWTEWSPLHSLTPSLFPHRCPHVRIIWLSASPQISCAVTDDFVVWMKNLLFHFSCVVPVILSLLPSSSLSSYD